VEDVAVAILTEEMKQFVREQRLGFIATVCPDNTPNLSPKGTLTVWDNEHLVFADIRSPGTIGNLRLNRSVEVNVVDPIIRKGWRFKGEATILESGPQFEEITKKIYHADKQEVTRNNIRAVVLIEVARALPLISPTYDRGRTENEVRGEWERYWEGIRKKRTA
jgi:predicted pyridoxine 5'-phosphate oxidase superfamily flavin-nucleotide-binding protein